ncbi:MAG: prolipoprotein diacylglyceryl transferase [Planctomycetota bacterium]|jgi:prolipoprotein diacylglyceryl transferase|nr:prolipoprotein diacylglyceryl transferase [Planctomycetota bacterium]
MPETVYYDAALGVVHNLDPVLFSLGSLQIRYYGVIFALSLLAAFYLWQWQMRRGNYPQKTIDAIIVYGVVGTIVGARLGHCLFYEWDVYRADPWRIWYFWEGGLASHGAAAGILLALGVYAWRYRLNYWEMTDRFTFSAAIAAAGVRVGNFFNSEIVGRITDFAGGVRFVRYDLGALPPAAREAVDAPLRHPSQIYEFLMALAILACLYFADRWAGGEKRPRGMLLGLFFGLYFAARFSVEFFKEYQTDLRAAQGLTMGQYLSIVPCLLGWALFAIAWRRRNTEIKN